MVTATETQVAGRELDALVAERVMGCNVGTHGARLGPTCLCPDAAHAGLDHGFIDIAEYSTDIQAAWEVVEHLSILYRVEVYELDSGWVCKLTTRDTMPAISLDGKQTRMYHGELGGGGSGLAPKTTAPFAICQAALKAAEYERRGNH